MATGRSSSESAAAMALKGRRRGENMEEAAAAWGLAGEVPTGRWSEWERRGWRHHHLEVSNQAVGEIHVPDWHVQGAGAGTPNKQATEPTLPRAGF